MPNGVTQIQIRITPSGAANGDIDSSNLLDNVKVCPSSQTQAQATIYQHCNFGGSNVQLGIGSYPNMPSIGSVNNFVSSLRVPSGLQVTLFDNTNFGGSSITFTADDNCLVNNSFNDRTGSIIVESVNAAARAIERSLYVAPMFGQKTKLEWYFTQEEDKKVKQYLIMHSTHEEEEMK